MALYNPLKGEYLYDVAVKLYNDTALGIQDLISLNSGINIDLELYGMELTYTAGLSRVKPVFPLTLTTSGEQTYKTRYKQTIYDLAIQLHGDISKIGNLIEYFPNLDNEIPVGSELSYMPDPDPIAVYFTDQQIIIATDINHINGILEEDGGFILMEDGKQILLE